MAKPDLKFHAGHRQRLREKFLADKITDYEFLELLLSFVIPRRDVRPLARNLIQKYSGLHQICSLTIEQLTSEPGIGQNTAIFLKAIRHAMLAEYREHLDKRPVFHKNSVFINYCLTQFAGKDIEEFRVWYMDAEHRLIADDLHSTGTIDWAGVYPREITRRALNLGARSVALMHNHPTAGTTFSSPDIEVTMLLQDMLRAVGIELFDHFLICGGQVQSARNKMLLQEISNPRSQNPKPADQK